MSIYTLYLKQLFLQGGLIVLFSFPLFAQNKIEKERINDMFFLEKIDQKGMKYESFLEKGEIKLYNIYQKIVSKTADGKYIVRTFYPERNQITSLLTYKTKKLEVLTGKAEWWYDSGKKEKEGWYKNGEIRGIWKYYNRQTGILTAEGKINAAEWDGKWRNYTKEGQLESIITWRKGTRHGSFEVYNKLGIIVNKGTYENDVLIEQSDSTYDGVNKPKTNEEERFTYKNLMQKPRFPGCEDTTGDNDIKKKCADTKLLEFIYSNIQYPDTARLMQVEGKVIMTFTIDKEGHIIDVEVLRGISASLEKECRRIMSLMPIWNPGLLADGKPVDVRYNLPINFKLD